MTHLCFQGFEKSCTYMTYKGLEKVSPTYRENIEHGGLNIGWIYILRFPC